MIFCSPVTSIFIPGTTFSIIYKVDQSAGGDGYDGNPWHVDRFSLGNIKELKAGQVGRTPLTSSSII